MPGESGAAPRIAVLVVHWNRPHETVACVRSLQQTGYPALDITIVDNDSAAEAVAVLQARLPEVPIVRSPYNSGYAGAFNLGARHVLAAGRPEYLWLLNNDTSVAPNCPAALVAASRRWGPAIYSPKILQWDAPDRLWYAGGYLESNLKSHHVGRNEPDRGQYDAPQTIPWASGCSLFMERAVWERVGPMTEDYFLYLEDVDWCLRAGRAGIPTWYVPDAVVYHGISKSVELLDRRAVVYYAWRNYYVLALRNGALVQKLRALGDLASRLVKTAVKLTLVPSARRDALYAARTRALLDVVRRRMGPAPYRAAAPTHFTTVAERV